MKKLLLIVSIAGAAFGLVGASIAQGPGPRGPQGGPPGRMGGPGGGMRMGPGGFAQFAERRAKMEKEMFAKLKLSPDQAKKVAALQKARDAKMKKLMDGMKPGDMGGMREKMRPIRDEYQKGLDGVLKPDQKKKLDDLRKEMRAKMGGPGGPGGRGPGGPGGFGGPGRGPGGPRPN